MRGSRWILVVALVLGATTPAAAQRPIPETGGTTEPSYVGAPATPQPLSGMALGPQHPFLAADGRSNLHNDAYMSDVYASPGPLGDRMERTSVFEARECASVAFDTRGRIVTICVGLDRPVLTLKDPVTLRTLASLDLPARRPSPGADPFSDFTGGGYFVLDERDRAILPTTDRRLLVVELTPATEFRIARDVDLGPSLKPDDKIVSVLPDWRGRLWFVAASGIVGNVGRDGGTVRVLDTGERITNSFSVDEDGGVYVVTDGALYRLDDAGDGTPAVTWRLPYENTGLRKPGQVNAGSGTTPTLMAGGFVAITDNADPINVVVAQRGRVAAGPREICRQPVFERGASATDNSLIAAGTSIVVENNHGYSGPTSVEDGRSTSPGIERVDFDPAARTCRRVWRSEERSPSVVPKLSLANGLVYIYVKEPREDREDVWYLTALDFRTGRTVYKVKAGEGLGFNNNYAPVTLGPDGSAYVGVLGGLVRLADAVPPAGAVPPSRPCVVPRLYVRARAIGDARLGMRAERLAALGARVGRTAGRRCVEGGGTIRAAFDRRGRVGLLATTARGHTPGRVRIGDRHSVLAREFPRARRVTRRVLRSGPRGRLLFGVRDGRVRWIAVVPLRTGDRPAEVRRLLRSAGLAR